MRVPGLSLVGLLLSISAAAQDSKPVRVCVVAAEVPAGNAVVRSADPKPQRDLLLNKLNTNSKVLLLARSADSGEGVSCSALHAKAECQYIVAVSPIMSGRYSYVAPLPTQSSESDKAPQPDKATQFVQEHQQEPLDQATVRYQVFENGNCRLVAVKNLSKLQNVDGPPTKESIHWLTSKVAEGVSAAIARDVKKQRP